MFEKIKDTFYIDFEGIEIVEEQESYVILSEDRVGKNYKVSEQYLATFDLLKDNKKINKFTDRGFKFGDYVELLIECYSVFDYGDDFELDEFFIGEVEVKIAKPSIMFNLVMSEFQGDKYYESGSFWTISLKGINGDNFEEYLSNAVFFVGYYNQAIFGSDYPNFYEFIGEDFCRYSLDEDVLEERRDKSEEFNNYSGSVVKT